MTLLLKALYYTIKHISTIVTFCLFLIGSALFFLPVYHLLFSIVDKENLKRFSYTCLHRLGLLDVISLCDTAVENSSSFYYSTSALSSVDDNVTYELNLPIDTQVCLLPEHSSAMVAGLVNTGNSCFLNSVLQSLSSLPKLQIYLDQLNSAYSSNKIPVTQSLLKTLRLLSKPSEGTFQPIDVVRVLRNNRRVINREQQDAQELYQLLISELETETSKLSQKQGLKDILSLGASDKNDVAMTDNPLTGSIAYQTTCTKCGYASGIPMHSFNNVQLALPAADVTTLDECLKQLTSVEYLNDVECSKCSLINTLQTLGMQIESLQQENNDNTERLQYLRTVREEIKQRLETGNIEQENNHSLREIISKSFGVKSKQGTFARPPKVLCLHFVRSIYLPSGEVVKNTCQVQYPEMLDLTPYCTDETLAKQPMSTPGIKYRLMSSVVHYGGHNSGHYIAYKRRLLADHCGCETCGHDNTKLKSHDSEWFKISDDKVRTCEADDALRENPFMLLYELIEQEDAVPELGLTPTAVASIDTAIDHLSLQQQQQDYFWQGSESDQEDLEDLLAINVPGAPPSSPIMEPSLTYTKKPNKKKVSIRRYICLRYRELSKYRRKMSIFHRNIPRIGILCLKVPQYRFLVKPIHYGAFWQLLKIEDFGRPTPYENRGSEH
ncbi:hypothetical protein [Parasitella parasitica]|uniref:ubiquitinyl hydrolase 1 n=1 Tax=Parasitella parasitica TaxID=35722 RepID=A0A0B7N7T2_9FUNG|nr:hypothetical protein [Parasitella parasitica]